MSTVVTFSFFPTQGECNCYHAFVVMPSVQLLHGEESGFRKEKPLFQTKFSRDVLQSLLCILFRGRARAWIGYLTFGEKFNFSLLLC